jgi:hypothetical protein
VRRLCSRLRSSIVVMTGMAKILKLVINCYRFIEFTQAQSFSSEICLPCAGHACTAPLQ